MGKFIYEQYELFISKMINEELSEQISRGDIKNLNISSILIRSYEESLKKVIEIPILNHCKIKEKIFENFIKGKIEKKT